MRLQAASEKARFLTFIGAGDRLADRPLQAATERSAFATPEVQKKWWSLGGYSCLKSVLQDPGFVKSAPFAKEFLESMDMVDDFWAEPSYAQLLLAMQKRVHDYVVADKGTAKEALDLLVTDWTKVFKEEGKLK